MENLEFVFVNDGDVITVTGLAYRDEGHVDAGDVVDQGSFRRKKQREVLLGGSSHGAFVPGGDYDAIGGPLLIEEVE